jgi:NAD(P)-dependent dehydrogenase (short-subunit alcohol dehydrogenase family)
MTTIVITGSTQGIGRGLAADFCRRGDNVLVAGRDGDRVAATVAELNDSPGHAAGQPCDVSQVEQVQALWDLAINTFGQVDIWINNAGLARTVWPILEIPQGEMETMVSTNMLGTINGSRVAATGMVAQGQGKLFNVLGGGSDGEYFPGLGLYGTTKRGLDYFTNALVKELAGTAVMVGKIRPGMIITVAVVREARADMENFQKSRKIMNNLVDTVDTVAPFLVDRMLATNKSGTKIRWLNSPKMAARMLRGMIRTRPDQFEPFGL